MKKIIFLLAALAGILFTKSVELTTLPDHKAALYVSGRDEHALLATLRQTAWPGQEIRPVETGLEDAFIALMRRAADNLGAAS